MRVLPAVVLALACAPKIDPGPIEADQIQAPVRLVEAPDPDSPNVYLAAMVRAGSALDSVGKEGLAHLTAQALVQAGAGDRNADAVREALYPIAADFDLVVSQEWVALRLACHHAQAALCVELFADVLTSPRFAEDDVSRLRDEAIYAVDKGLLSNDEALGEAGLNALVYEAHPYGHPTEGRSGSLELLDAEHSKAFHARHYVRHTTTVGIAGQFSPELVSDLRSRLEVLPAAKAPELLLPKPLGDGGRRLMVMETANDVTGFHLAHPLEVDRNHEDWPALALTMTAFGAHRQSFGQLFQVLRTDRGLNYGDYAYIEPYVERGWTSQPEQGVLRTHPMFMLWIRPTSTENGPFALKLAISELEKLVESGLTEEQLEATKSYLIGSVPLLATDPGRRLAYALEAEATGTPNMLTHLPQAIADLSTEDIRAAAAEHLRPDDLRIVAVTGDDTLADRLLGEDPTPVVYTDVEPGKEQATRDAEVAAASLAIQADQAWAVASEGFFR
jgi:zinc protease